MLSMVQAKFVPNRSYSLPIHFHDQRSLKVGLIGGSFNPPHEGHLNIAKTALRVLGLNEVWWLVSSQNPLKIDQKMMPLETRLKKTIELAKHPKFKVLSLDNSFNTNRTNKLLKYLLPRCPSNKFIWLMGIDNLVEQHKWEKFNFITSSLPIAIFSRPGFSFRALSIFGGKNLGRRIKSQNLMNLYKYSPPAWGYIDKKRFNISSTQMRKKIKKL